MKSSIQALLLTAATLSNAQSYYNITSKPFHLVLTFPDGKKTDTLSACHTGAALESLCLSNSNSTSKSAPIAPAEFHFNTSIYASPPSDNLGTPGLLTWNLPTSQLDVPSSANFNYDPTTNIAVPILQPGDDGTQLAFDSKDGLVVQGYIDWSANPPAAMNTTQYSRWYACDTYYSGYQYNVLAWGLGTETPQNPSCVKVDVKRVFI